MHFHPVWVAEHKTKGHRKHFRDLAKLSCVVTCTGVETVCTYCDKLYSDQLDHFFHECDKYAATRELFWLLLVNICCVELSTYLYNLPQEELSGIILGRSPNIQVSQREILNVLEICAKCWQLLSYDKDLRLY